MARCEAAPAVLQRHAPVAGDVKHRDATRVLSEDCGKTHAPRRPPATVGASAGPRDVLDTQSGEHHAFTTRAGTKAADPVADDLIENAPGRNPVAGKLVHLPLDGDVFPAPPIGVKPQFADRRRWKSFATPS
jgi:hypothetical protein